MFNIKFTITKSKNNMISSLCILFFEQIFFMYSYSNDSNIKIKT